ncbi:MAG: hypothetical protein ACTSP3_02440 [Candidatus Heimdallarchaeaceae archaeon]
MEDIKERINGLIFYPKLSTIVESASEILTELDEFRKSYFKGFSEKSQLVLSDLGKFSCDRCKQLLSGEYLSYRGKITHQGVIRTSREILTPYQIMEYSTIVTILILLVLTAFSPDRIFSDVKIFETKSIDYEELQALCNKYTNDFFNEANLYEVRFEQKNINSGEILKKNILLKYKGWEYDLIVFEVENPMEGFLLHSMIYSSKEGSSSKVYTRLTIHPMHITMIVTDNTNQKHIADVFLKNTSGIDPVIVKFKILRIHSEKYENIVFA